MGAAHIHFQSSKSTVCFRCDGQVLVVSEQPNIARVQYPFRVIDFPIAGQCHYLRMNAMILLQCHTWESNILLYFSFGVMWPIQRRKIELM